MFETGAGDLIVRPFLLAAKGTVNDMWGNGDASPEDDDRNVAGVGR